MIVLREVVAYLEDRGVRYALIGGVALAMHGIARATLDSDLLVVDRVVLDPAFWGDWKADQAPDIQRGDADDPLAGVVRLRRDEEAVDVIVGRHAWEANALERRIPVTVEDHPLFVVDTADLIVLKLAAGGPQDVLDIRLLLAAQGEKLRGQVQSRLSQVSQALRDAWKTLLRADAAPTPS